MSEDIYCADATELASRIHSKELSPVEVMRAHLERTEAVNPVINAIATLADDAMERARAAEEAVVRGQIRGPLHGVPFTAKDCFDTEGVKTTRGSQIFAGHVPNADATAVRRLKEAGGVLLGKTNLPEFALRAETVNLVFGRTVHPWNADLTSGGSSGGETAAISAGLSPLGIGTDLGGSNRLPSHYCGIVGFKPTHGRIPQTGSWPELMSRHMHVGPICRTVRDAALALVVLSGPDGVDPYSLPIPVPQLEDLQGEVPSLKVGWFAEGPFAPVDQEIQDAVTRAASILEELGCAMEPATFAWEGRLPIDLCMDMVVAEGGHYLQPFIAGREDELTPAIKGLLDLPAPSLESYMTALTNRELLAQDVALFFSRCDLLLCPTAPNVAHPHEAETLTISGREVGPGHAANITATFGLTGSPALSIPFAINQDGLPIGVQLAARHGDESTLLRAAAALEAAGDGGHPPI